MVKFIEEGHKYESVEPDDIKWLGVTTLVGHLHEKFSSDTAEKCSSRKPTSKYPNKWYGLPVDEIKAAWDAERDRSAELGHWYHKLREDELYKNPVIYKSDIRDGIKYAPDQTLYEGIYPEHFVYLKSEQLCGQSDYVEVKGSELFIRDYKTSKEIKRKGFTNWEGITKKMIGPVSHLDDCHFNHYSLQLSIYMYIMIRHNPYLTPGKMFIEHVKFDIDKEDKYGYPIYKKDEQGNFIVKEIEEIEVPYLKKEVYSIMNWLKSNRHKLQK